VRSVDDVAGEIVLGGIDHVAASSMQTWGRVRNVQALGCVRPGFERQLDSSSMPSPVRR